LSQDLQPATKKAAVKKMEVVEKPAAAKADAKADEKQAEKPAEKKKVDNRKLQRKLQARTDLKVEDLPLKDVVKKLADLHEIPIRLDEDALKKAGVAPDKPITAAIENFTLSLSLKHILKDLNLHFGVVDGEIVIGNEPPQPVAEVRAAAAVEAAEEVILQPQVMMLGNGPGGAGMAQQFTRQHKALVKAELNLIRAVCQPTDEQMQQIRGDVEKNLKTKVTQVEEQQKKMARQQPGAQISVGDPLQLSRSWILKAANEHLTAEQAALYKREVDQRLADRRQASIDNVVARLDRDLVLSAKQREQIATKLRDNWKDAWSPSPIQFMQMDQWYPNIPDQYIVEFLEAEQKQIWKQNRNQNRGVVFGQQQFAGFMGGMFGDEFLLQDDEADAAPKSDDQPKAEDPLVKGAE
jgi:hypothetical protein